MWPNFTEGYREAGGPRLTDFLGGVLGMAMKTALQTVVVVIVLRALGVL